MEKPDLRILVTGGGTGGHVSPALAVVQKIRSMADRLERRPVFRYLGSLHGVERELADEAGIEFRGVQTGKLRRARRWWGMINRKNVADLMRVPVGISQAFAEVKRFKPDVVLATGGYVAVPPVIAAALRKVPVLIHEQTVQIGLANQIAAKFASRIALTFEGSALELPVRLRQKAFVTGNPVRAIVFGGDRARAYERFGFDSPITSNKGGLPVIYITGGALGARVINRAVASILPELLKRARVIHQCGRQPEGTEQDYDVLKSAAESLPEDLKRRYFVTPFVREEIGDIYAICDLVVGRSGAGTVAEICALGKPAVLIPLVPTGGDEQTRNAKRLADIGAAVIIKNADLTGPILLDTITRLLDDPEKLKSMASASGSLATPNAAEDLADALLGLARPAAK
jgi:UDP-N-acetylglucosamine--N-acetylmuramyl-(pentapeptide) pyrophosphoryl-undecaprenol N-acetylglucosamine transferase